MITTSAEGPAEKRGVSPSIQMSLDPEADACYLYLEEVEGKIYRRQVVTEFEGFEVVIDVADDGRLGGIEIIGASAALPKSLLNECPGSVEEMTVEEKAPVPRVQLVIGIIRRGDEILLVREALGASGEMKWALPGGGVQDGELMNEALRREMQEETGLTVGTPAHTAFLLHIDSERHPSAVAVAFEVSQWSGEVAPDDADIAQAAFFPLPEALRLLGELDSVVQRDPIVGYLSGEVPAGTTWLYRSRAGDETLVARW